MIRPTIIVAALLLAACGGSTLAPQPAEIVAADGERAFMRWDNGWRLSLAPPRFPYNTETVVFEGMSGVGTRTPFGCGVEFGTTSYFATPRGPLVCAIGQADGTVRLAPVGQARHNRVFDAAATPDGLTVVTTPPGGGLAVISLSPQGDLLRQTMLPVRNPDQVVILPSGRLVVLKKQDDGCFWTVFERDGETYRPAAATPADHPYQCHSASSAGAVIRDQTTGEAYLHFDHPTKSRLYRIGEPGADRPAVLIAADIADGIPLNESSEPRQLTINDGVLLFAAGRSDRFGPRVGVRDLRRGRSGYLDFPGSGSPHPSANARILAFLAPAAPGGSPRLVLQHPRTGHSTIETIDLSAVIYD